MKKAKAKVSELFTWYAGPTWREDWQTTNTMLIDGVHAQDESKDGLDALAFLVEHENEEVEIIGEEVEWTWDLEFTIKDRHFTVQSIDFYGETSFE
jgi:hypothetical protein